MPRPRTLHVHPVSERASRAAHAFAEACRDAARRHGFELAAAPGSSLVALGPCLRRKLAPAEWSAPRVGTLIFHPSALPLHRGPDAIRWTLAARERVSASSWFWCDDGLDTGPVCEQELVVLDPADDARAAYERRFIPAALRALDRALRGIADGAPRRVPQEDRLATYESFLPRGSSETSPAAGAPSAAEPGPAAAAAAASRFRAA
ncbi:MAG TPA: formyltransferase family protein [Anaeromyxobacteraceae bacterium]|nr:formyltransferase family protein [Anaeromyxobacteraceae bacterium]